MIILFDDVYFAQLAGSNVETFAILFLKTTLADNSIHHRSTAS